MPALWDKWRFGPRQIRLVFLAVMILLASTLGGVAWLLLKQDRQLANQRLGERQDAAADLAVTILETRLAEIDQDLSRMLAGKGEKPVTAAARSIFFQFLQGSVQVWPDDGLIYYPAVPEASEASEALFAAADELEFQRRDYLGAVAALRQPAMSDDRRIRAAAFVRIARNYLKGGFPQEALSASGQLAELGAVPIGGMPAALAGRLSAIHVHERQKDQESLITAIRELEGSLNSGRWKISSAAYASLSQEVRRVGAGAGRFDQSRTALAAGVEWLWERWNRERSTLMPDRLSLAVPSGQVLLIWKTAGNSAAGFAAGADFLEEAWLAELKPRLASSDVQLSLIDSEGRLVSGKPPGAASRPAVRLESETALPWTIQAFSSGEAGVSGSRRMLLLTGTGVLLALILTGTWFIGYAAYRELAVARLQTEFVSGVSHEFRTPLTTLCQLSELLKRDRVSSEQDRRQYYDLLYNESHRLRRLVEALLDLGRLEAGKLQFHFEALDASALVRQFVAEFMESQQTPGHRFEVDARESPIINADRETLRCVFWNLFENAVKYSPGCDTVWVSLCSNNQHVEIAVRDGGVGIPGSEHRRIFEKFVRGASARESNIRGAGIGLAVARQIVREHGGDIILESEPGKGSTFRVVLPEMRKQT